MTNYEQETANDKYYITKVDTISDSIYIHHDLMGELLIPTHQHQKAQFLYTEGGIVFLKTDLKEYFLPARHFIWIPAGVNHSIHPSSEKVIMRNLYFPVEKTENEFYSKEGIYPVNDLLLQLLLFTKRWNGDLIKNTDEYFVSKALKVILPQICKTRLPLSLPFAKDPRLIKVIEYIDENLHENILFESLAVNFGFSERSLYRLFQKDLGMSFMKFFTIKRMLKALELILEQQIPINEISLAVGYSSVTTFSNTFYKCLGQRPSDYRKGIEILK